MKREQFSIAARLNWRSESSCTAANGPGQAQLAISSQSPKSRCSLRSAGCKLSLIREEILRRLMNQHHPDKLVAKGLPEEMIDIATQKTQDIKAAYELIKKHRS